MTAPDTAQLRLDAAVAQIEEHGFAVEFVEWCENPDTPGLLGSIRGVTDWQKRLVRIGRRANPTTADLAATAEHELRHVTDPAWDCGNRDVFGRGGGTAGRRQALTEAWQAVDRAVRPLGYGGGATNSPWNQGYEQAKNEALNAILAVRDGT